MRVNFSCELKPDSGKQNFAIRLATALKSKGIKVTSKNPDINIVFIKGIQKRCVNVLRLDNAWFNNKMNSVDKNKKIRKIMGRCNGVVYQGNYSKSVCDKFIGTHKKYAIIPNGCFVREFQNPYKHPKPYILTFSRWRPHKRLKVMVDGFLESGLKSNYDLIVCGNADYVVQDEAVKYFGTKTNVKICNLVAGCEFVVHLAYMDCCPNSVVESLVAGKRILYSDSGGMSELVGDCGFKVKDKPFEFKMIDLYNSPELDMNEIICGYKFLANKVEIYRPDLYIENIADKYISFFKKFL